MKTYGRNAARFAWMMVTLILVGLFHTALAQVTNGNILTNTPPIDPSNPFPQGKDAAWLILIPPLSATITWLIGKIPPLPKVILPWITPLAGLAIGAALKYGAGADLPWWSVAGAGAIATTLYEGLKGITGAGPESALTPTPEPAKTTINNVGR